VTDFDNQGLIYWLGTQLDSKQFTNPHETGHLLVKMSSVQCGMFNSELALKHCHIPLERSLYFHFSLSLSLFFSRQGIQSGRSSLSSNVHHVSAQRVHPH
jgi:hypothetical protein